MGDTVPLPAEVAPTNAALAMVGPDGSTITLPAGTTNFPQALTPGVYRLSAGGVTQRFAVNLDPAESRTAPLPLDELEHLGAPARLSARADAPDAARKVQLQNAELESRQKLWRWFILATLAVLLAETWRAGRTTRRLAPSESASL